MTGMVIGDDDIDEPPANVRGSAKLQRWVDLLASLLSRTLPATFAELAVDVPEYRAKLDAAEESTDGDVKSRAHAAVKRTFERDKADLRLLGINIESLEDGDGNAGGAYRLQRRDFYLPYLTLLAADGSRSNPNRPNGYGYTQLASLTFDADELQSVVDAALHSRALGDPFLAQHANSALRKLAFDLPIGATDAVRAAPQLLQSRAQVAAETFAELGDALRRRKWVTFIYRSFSSGTREQRQVEPFGVFFLHGNWYLVGRDADRGELRNFRLSRIDGVAVNAKNPQRSDYEVPDTFSLRDHATSRQAWELGEEEPVSVQVRFAGESGPVIAARRLGELVSDNNDIRAFAVRRMDTFVRWLLSFAGDAIPVSPREAVQQYESLRAEVRAMYDRAAPSVSAVANADAPAIAPVSQWKASDAAAQFQRLVQVIPVIADGEPHRIDELARHVGCSPETLHSDLWSLVLRYDTPGGFVEGVQVLVESERVSATSNHLKRPMRLTTPELRALELGLSVLRNHRAPDEHGVLERARERIRALLPSLGPEGLDQQLGEARLATEERWELVRAVRAAQSDQRQLRITYRKSGSDLEDVRVVCPYALLAANGTLYILAHCMREADFRMFRIDRIEHAEVLSERFDVPGDFSVDSVVSANRAMLARDHDTMTVVYSPRIARWIAEREGVALKSGEPLVLEHPVADLEWAVRHVLQYGVDAEVVGPEEVREAVGSTLDMEERQ